MPSDPEELRDVLRLAASRTTDGDLFGEFDADLDGRISKVEFRRSIGKLGFHVDKRVADALFSLLDHRNEGAVEWRKMNRMLITGMVEFAEDEPPPPAPEAPSRPLLKAKSASSSKSVTAPSHPALSSGHVASAPRSVSISKEQRATGRISPEPDRASDRSSPVDAALVSGVVTQLRDALTAQASRVIDLFSEWDDDGDGLVSKLEFRKAMPMIGLQVSRRDAERLFDSFDPDGSGCIDYRELHKLLRRQDAPLRKALQAGGAGEIKTSSSNARRLRQQKSGGGMLRGVDIDEESSVPVAEQLSGHLSKHAVRVIDLFREWDDDGDGVVNRAEFRKAMPMLGLEVSREAVLALFDSWDPDHSGTLTISELSRRLRRGGEVELDESLRVGATVKVFFRSRNKVQLRKLRGVPGSAAYATLAVHNTDASQVQGRLRDALSANAWRVADLLCAWEKDGDSLVSRDEFVAMLPAVGIRANREAALLLCAA